SVIVPRLVFLAAIIPAYQLIVAPGVTVETLVLTNITLNFLLGLSYGGLYVLITQIFPMAVRSSGLSLAYAI
ncbi:MAG TPA: MFS transporter, partial [Alphaproteobacteria bacterium]|nr:MFS transporter [Alphaproteobacteria bacterium]